MPQISQTCKKSHCCCKNNLCLNTKRSSSKQSIGAEDEKLIGFFFTVEGIFCSASASWPFCNNSIKSDRTEGFHTLQIGSKDFRFKAVKIRSYKSFIAPITPKFRNVKNFDYNFLVKIFGGMKFWRNLS